MKVWRKALDHNFKESLGTLISNDALLPAVHENDSTTGMLPLGPLNELESVTVRHGYVLAHDLDIVNRLVQVIVDVLLHREDRLRFIRHFQLLGQVNHLEVRVLIREWKQLELDVCSIISWLRCRIVGASTLCRLLLDKHVRVKLALGDSPLVRLKQQNALELVILLFEVWDEPIDDVLKGDVSNDGLQRLSTEVNLASRATRPRRVLIKEGVDASFAEGTHAFVNRVSVTVHALAQIAGQVIEHIGLGRFITPLGDVLNFLH